MSTDRHGMVVVIEKEYGLDSPNIAGALLKVPREEFAPKRFRNTAYDDRPIDIGYGQTMSQPYTVALMTHLATEFAIFNFQFPKKLQITNTKYQSTKKGGRVLEIGTGSGYQAAILSYFFDEVYTIEIVPQLAKWAGKTLKRLGYKNVYLQTGSGERGWKEKSLFDAIIITAGVEEVPNELIRQLKYGGVLVAPVGKGYDKIMTRYTKINSKFQIPNSKSILNYKIIKKENSRYLVETFGTFHFVPFIKSTIS